MQIFDVTIPLSSLTPVWEGDKGVTIQRSASLGPESDYNVSRIELGVHSGTHIDAPFHVIKNGKTVDAISLKKLIGSVEVVSIPDGVNVINDSVLKNLDTDYKSKKLILKTSNSRFWDHDPKVFRSDYVGIDTSAAEYLKSFQLDLLGIDFFSVSAYQDLQKPHEILLLNGVVLLENLDLRKVDPGMYDLFCLPLKLEGTDGAPARVILTHEN